MRGERPKGKSELRDRNEKLPPISNILCLLRIRTVFEKGTRVCVCVRGLFYIHTSGGWFTVTRVRV